MSKWIMQLQQEQSDHGRPNELFEFADTPGKTANNFSQEIGMSYMAKRY
ncbi:hypothetical protein [Desulfocastanea catecholica]